MFYKRAIFRRGQVCPVSCGESFDSFRDRRTGNLVIKSAPEGGILQGREFMVEVQHKELHFRGYNDQLSEVIGA